MKYSCDYKRENFKKIIEKLIEEKKLTNAQLAEYLNLDPNHISDYKNGRREVQEDTLCLLANKIWYLTMDFFYTTREKIEAKKECSLHLLSTSFSCFFLALSLNVIGKKYAFIFILLLSLLLAFISAPRFVFFERNFNFNYLFSCYGFDFIESIFSLSILIFVESKNIYFFLIFVLLFLVYIAYYFFNSLLKLYCKFKQKYILKYTKMRI